MSNQKMKLVAAFTVVMAGGGLITGGAAHAEPKPLPKVELKFPNDSVLRFYGQINKGVLSYDDGLVSESYGLIDNNNSNTRVGLTYNAKIGDSWKYLGTLELQYAPFSTSTASILQPSPLSDAYMFTNANIRQIDNKLTNETYGSFYLGQGNMASNDTAKVDLSGTTVTQGVAVQDLAGGQLLRLEDGTLSKVKIKDAFKDYNGLGRKVRVRYDTPSFNGFTFRTSYGQDQLSSVQAVQNDPLYDVAVAYEGEAGDFKYAAQAAYSWAVGDSATVTTLDGSASVLHKPTGLNLTLAAASSDNEVRTGTYWYVKAGWLADLVSWGKTAFAIDYYQGNDIFAAGADSSSASISVVQSVVSWNTEIYAAYRTYSASTATVAYDDSNAFFFGARFKW